MTELEWLGGSDPAPLLHFLREQQVSERKLRLLACACCRRIWHLLPDPRSRLAVEVAERYADEQATLKELARARTQASVALKKSSGPDWGAYWAANVKAAGPIWNVFAAAAVPSAQVIGTSEATYDANLAWEFRRQVA